VSDPGPSCYVPSVFSSFLFYDFIWQPWPWPLWLAKLLFLVWMCFWYYNYKCRMFCIFLFLISLTILFYMWMIVYGYHHAKEHKMSEKKLMSFGNSLFQKHISKVTVAHSRRIAGFWVRLWGAGFLAGWGSISCRGFLGHRSGHKHHLCSCYSSTETQHSFIFETCPLWQGTVKQLQNASWKS